MRHLLCVPSSVWKGYISFGLVTIPVALYRAARPERVKLRQVHQVSEELLDQAEHTALAPVPALVSPKANGTDSKPPVIFEPDTKRTISAAALATQEESQFTFQESQPAFEPVKRVSASSTTDTILPASEVKKGYEFAPDQFVTIDAEELKSIAPQNSADMDIVEFVQLAAIDPIYFETSYYVRPEKAGEKPYALLHAAMVKTGLAGIARFAMRRREHMVVLRPGKSGLVAHTMYFSSEVRAEDEFKVDAELVTPKELELANALVTALSTEFDASKFRDTYKERLEELIAAKVQSKPSMPEQPQRRRAPVADIADALRASLSKLKKPVAAEQPQPREKKRRAR